MLKIILSVIFILICVALTVVVYFRKENQQALAQSAEWLILTGEKTKDVPWKAICRSLPPLQLLHLWYWQLF